ncbi:hypothetical protein niasHT_000206 [Heterodera trifolii]|uniref:PH domain-containing protein n=1 Tax=Heterodera trifolii TaxID=157864 RepID=A0ABD2LWP5_9BILA
MAIKCDENSLNESPKASPTEIEIDSLVSSVHFQRLFRLFLLFAGNQMFWHCPGARLLRFIRRTQSQFILCQMCQIRDQILFRPVLCLRFIRKRMLSSELETNQQTELEQFKMPTKVPTKKTSSPSVCSFGVFVRFCPSGLIRKGFLFARQIASWPKNSKSPPTDKLLKWQQKKRKTFAAFCHPLGGKGKWHTFWCVLVPGQLHLWPQKIGQKNCRENPSESTEKITVKFQRDTLVKYTNEESEEGHEKGLFGWHLVTFDGIFEFAHFDQLQRQLWIADIELAIRKRNPSLLCQFDRANSFRKIPEEILMEKLESEKRELEKALETEREALGDEKHKRQMGTKKLEEEKNRGERLKRTVQTLQEQLETEKRQRMANERSRNEEKSDQQQKEQSYEASRTDRKWDGDQQRQQGEGTTTQMRPLATIRPVTPKARTKRGKRWMRDELKRREQQQKKRGEGKEEQKKEKKEQKREKEEDNPQKRRREMSENGRRPAETKKFGLRRRSI